MMDLIQRVAKTDLARNTKEILRAVQRGQTTIVEGHGRAEVAIVDVIDYWLMRAVMSYYTHSFSFLNPEEGLTEEAVNAQTDTQARYNIVMAHYLAVAISLARAAELLGLTWLDLRARAVKLDIPLRVGGIEELKIEITNALEWHTTQE